MCDQDIFTPICIRNARIFSENGFIENDLLIFNQIIERIGNLNSVLKSGCIEIDAKGATLLPSLIDMHVHLREPGFSYKETIFSGSRAAAAGGFTTVCTMPNLKPAPDSLDHLQVQLDIINKDACIEVLPYATITKLRMGDELVDYSELSPYVAGFSDDGSGVQSEEVMKKAMTEIAKTGKILAAHCEVEALLDGGYIHKGEYAKTHGHKGISSESEWKEVERDIRLVEETGCRLHICHMSTKESVQLVKNAKMKGLPVTCETGPHYLTFSDNDLQEDGRFKMNPPLRSIEDREALRQGVIDGTIDVIATDHAPHSVNEKSRGLKGSAMGVVGLETAFSAVYTTMVKSGLMSFDRLIHLMAIKPREILGLKPMPYIKEGYAANCVIIDTEKYQIIDKATFLSNGKATPYEGINLCGKIMNTIFNGKIVFQA